MKANTKATEKKNRGARVRSGVRAGALGWNDQRIHYEVHGIY